MQFIDNLAPQAYLIPRGSRYYNSILYKQSIHSWEFVVATFINERTTNSNNLIVYQWTAINITSYGDKQLIHGIPQFTTESTKQLSGKLKLLEQIVVH